MAINPRGNSSYGCVTVLSVPRSCAVAKKLDDLMQFYRASMVEGQGSKEMKLSGRVIGDLRARGQEQTSERHSYIRKRHRSRGLIKPGITSIVEFRMGNSSPIPHQQVLGSHATQAV